MLQYLMQKPERVVPVEPTLKIYRYFLITGLVMSALYVGAFFTPPQVHRLDGPLLGNGALFLMFFVMNRGRGKALEKKRQQAAATNLTDHQLVKIIPVADIPALASNPALHMQRRWLTTWIVGFIGGLFLIGLGIVMYAASQSTMQDLIQYG